MLSVFTGILVKTPRVLQEPDVLLQLFAEISGISEGFCKPLVFSQGFMKIPSVSMEFHEPLVFFLET